jgi:hypothetical protein
MAAVEAEGGVTDVMVTAPYQVAYEGNVYSSGKTVTVSDDVAEAWLTNGWASRK